MKSLDINIDGLRNFSEEGRLKDLAVFLYLKSLHSNSCIYNYTQVSLSSKSGLSRPSVKKYVKTFLNSGWCSIHSGNLIFNKIKKFDHKKSKKIERVNITSVKDILMQLRRFILLNVQHKFNKLVKLNRDLLNSSRKISRPAQRRLEKFNLNENDLPGANDMVTISMKTIAGYFGCSVGSACEAIKQLKNKGLLSCIKEIKIIDDAWAKFSPGDFLSSVPNSYYHKNNIFVVSCNRYVFR